MVTAWLGNTPRIAMKHYLMVTEGDFQRAIGGGAQSGASWSTFPAQMRRSHYPPPLAKPPKKHIKPWKTKAFVMCWPTSADIGTNHQWRGQDLNL